MSRITHSKFFAHSIACIVVLMVAGFALSVSAQADRTYTPLAPIELGNTQIRYDLGGFIIDAFRIAVAASAALAVLMIIFGGFKYMSTDAWSGKSEGKTHIKQALLGLLFVMISFLVLETINPRFVDLSPITGRAGTQTNTSGDFGNADEDFGEVTPVEPTVQLVQGTFQHNGRQYPIIGLKDEDLTGVTDKDFYSFTATGAASSVTKGGDSMSQCLSLQDKEPLNTIAVTCHEVPYEQKQTTYKLLKNNTFINDSYLSMTNADCQAEATRLGGSAQGYSCAEYYNFYLFTKATNMNTNTNYTLKACQFATSNWATNHPGETVSTCSKQPTLEANLTK